MFKKHYNIVLVACCFTFLFANLGLASTSFPVHQPYIVALPGIGDTGGSLMLACRNFTTLVAIFFVDRYYELLTVRRGIFLATLGTAVGFFILSTATALPIFMLGAVFLGIGYGVGGLVAVTYLASVWFENGFGSMVGIAATGSSFASIIMPACVTKIIHEHSLSTAFLIEGCIAAGIAVIVYLLLRNKPSDLGIEPFETHKNAKKAQKRESAPLRPVPRRAHTLLMVAVVGVGIYACCGNAYISVLASSNGYDIVVASALVSTIGLALGISKFVSGELFDFLGAPIGSAVVMGSGILGYVLCSFAGLGNVPLLVAGAALLGAGLAIGSVGLSVWSIDLSTPETRTREIRNFQVAYAAGGFIANVLPGIIKDAVGTYVVTFAACAIIATIALIYILRFYRTYKHADTE